MLLADRSGALLCNPHEMLVILGGPAGSGKSTVCAKLAKEMGVPWVDGDDLHPQSNVDKMAHNIPLTDDDRWGWLEIIATKGSKLAEENDKRISIIACSALTKKYRDFLRKKSTEPLAVVFIYSTFEKLFDRVSRRSGHYMKADMVRSQVDLMEIPHDEPYTVNYDTWVVEDECEKTLWQWAKELNK